MPICQSRDVAFIINDDPQLALEMGADGVHIGADDPNYKETRKTVGDDAIVGVSCYDSKHAAMVAAEDGANYIAFGAFFPTKTKTPRACPDAQLLAWWNELMVIPSVAIGGINTENCAELVKEGTDFVAVIAGVWEYPQGPKAAVQKFNEIFKTVHESIA